MTKLSFFRKLSKKDSGPGALTHVPAFLREFIFFLLSRIEKIVGAPVGISVPDALGQHDEDIWEELHTLEFFKNKGVLRGYSDSVYRYWYPDEPNLPYLWNGFPKKEQYFGSVSTGYDFQSNKRAIQRMMGESYERWCLMNYSPPKDSIKIESLRGMEGDDHVDIEKLPGISIKQRKQGHTLYDLNYSKESFFEWTKGTSLITKKMAWIPTQLVTFSHKDVLAKKEEPLLRLLVSTGAATHKDKDQAILNGLCEIIERDAFMIYWVNKLTPQKINLKSVPSGALQEAIKRFEQYNVELHLVYLKTDMPVHTVLAVTVDMTGVGAAVSVGASAHQELERAIEGALLEGTMGRTLVRFFKDEREKKNRETNLKDYTRIGPEERMLFWYDPGKIKDIEFLIKGKEKSFEDFNKEQVTGKKTLNELLKFFKEKEYDLFCKDIGDETIEKATGLKTIMVVAPEMQPLHLDESIPYFSGKRMNEVPLMLGFPARDEKNRLPHPFP